MELMSKVDAESFSQTLVRDGVAVLPAAIGPGVAAGLHERTMRMSGEWIDDGAQRLFPRLVSRGPEFADLATAPWLLTRLDRIFAGVPHLVCSYGHVKPAHTDAHTVEHSDIAHLRGVPHDRCLLMVKVMLALTSVPADRSPTVLWPGTHRGLLPSGPMVATLEPGDALIFNANIRHTATANLSTMDRVSLWFVYAQPWMRTFPGYEHDSAFLASLGPRLTSDPRLRRVYGLDDPYAT
jgi:hypothetical protein